MNIAPFNYPFCPQRHNPFFGGNPLVHITLSSGHVITLSTKTVWSRSEKVESGSIYKYWCVQQGLESSK